jgi:sugar transferase (PEP-CTERM/EpsH1 system associated)
MNILYLAHRVPYPPNKGDKIRALWEIKSLSANHNIDLFTFYDHEEDRDSVAALKEYCRECYVEPLSWFSSRARAITAVLQRKPFSLAYFRSPRMVRRVRQALATRHYDVILCFGSGMAGYVDLQCSVPCVLDMVDVDSAKWAEYARSSSPLLRRLWRQEGELLAAYERFAAENFANTLLCTDAEAALLRSFAPKGRIGVLRHMVDTGYFDPEKVSLSEDIARLQPYVLFAGSMDYAPNVEAVQWFHTKTLPTMQREIPNLKFVIAGRNPAKAVQELASDASIVVTGTVADIRPYFRGACATVAPMQLARGVQNKILESMAMGIPAAASSKAAVAFPPEVAERVLVEDDPAALASKLIQLIKTGPKPPVSAIRQALEQVFGDSSLRAKLEQILEEAAQQARGCSQVATVGSAALMSSGERARVG